MFRRTTLAVAALVLLGGCAGDAPVTDAPTTTPEPAPVTTSTSGPAPVVGESTTTAATTATTVAPEPTQPAAPSLPGGPLPPFDLAGIAAAFDPLLEPIGYRVTRGALIDRSTYEARDDGTHLAVYVAPIGDIDLERYATDFLPLVRAFLPAVFDRWPGLESFDVCQEPRDWQGDGDPPSLTLLDVYREDSEGIDWGSVDIAEIDRIADERAGVVLWASREMRATDTWPAPASATP